MCRQTKSSFGYALAGTALSIGVLLATSTPAAARAITLFGPQQYVRTTGKPVTHSSTFRVPAEATDCLLLVRDGAGGAAAANNVSVKINGTELVDAKLLRSSDPARTAVELQAENTLDVTLKGKPGDQVTVEIHGELPDPRPAEPPPRVEPPPGWPADRPYPPPY
jgi:hypothetical protein